MLTREEEPAGAASRRPWQPAPAEFGRSAAACWCRWRDRIDAPGDDPASWTLATGAAGRPRRRCADLAFAWRAIRAVKSNAILLAADGATVGVGMGQVNRVDSARLAVARAGGPGRAARWPPPTRSSRSRTGCEVLIDGRGRAVVQPGGSIRDDEVIAAAEKAGITMYLTGTRHFFH